MDVGGYAESPESAHPPEDVDRRSLTASVSDENKHRSTVNVRRLQQTAKLFIDMKAGLMEDLNVENIHTSPPNASNIQPRDSTAGREGIRNSGEAVLSYSNRTKLRAERVNTYLNYYYLLIERAINTEDNMYQHEGVEGTYNPLQIIRNRKIRKKYHQPAPRELTFVKEPVIAIKKFTKKPNQVTPWLVDINERASDLTWRTLHWDELKKPDGKYWFKKRKNSYGHHRFDSQRSDKLLVEGSSNDDMSNSSASFNGTHLELPQFTIQDVDDPSDSEKARKNRFEKIIKKTKRLSRSPGVGDFKNDIERQVLRHSNSSRISNPTTTTYFTPADAHAHHSVVKDVPIISIGPRNKSDQDTDEEETNVSKSEIMVDLENEANRSLLLKQWNEMKYIKCTRNILKNRQETLKSVRNRNLIQRKRIPKKNFDELAGPTAEVIKEYQNKLTKAIEYSDAKKTKLLNDYSIRIETLISSTDRILSDINTTLTLRLKILQENMDRFGSLKNIHKQPLSQFLYRVLEICIVMVLWVIWFVFSIVRCGRILVATILKIVRWIVW